MDLMAAKNPDQSGDDNRDRAPWERPAFRRLATKYAEGAGFLQDEGVCQGQNPGSHSCKNT
jgi:hypothetical protein